MQVVETLARTGDQAAVAAFGQALAAQIANPTNRCQRAALARAALPLLERRNGDSAPALLATVAAMTLVPEESGADPTLRTEPLWQMPKARCDKLWRHRTMRTQRGSPPQLLQLLHKDLSTEPHAE